MALSAADYKAQTLAMDQKYSKLVEANFQAYRAEDKRLHDAWHAERKALGPDPIHGGNPGGDRTHI